MLLHSLSSHSRLSCIKEELLQGVINNISSYQLLKKTTAAENSHLSSTNHASMKSVQKEDLSRKAVPCSS